MPAFSVRLFESVIVNEWSGIIVHLQNSSAPKWTFQISLQTRRYSTAKDFARRVRPCRCRCGGSQLTLLALPETGLAPAGVRALFGQIVRGAFYQPLGSRAF